MSHFESLLDKVNSFDMADGPIRHNVIAAAMSSLLNVPEDIPGPLLAAGPKQKASVVLD